jgi:short subunit dehydrogenase-like uncharacterized protein
LGAVVAASNFSIVVISLLAIHLRPLSQEFRRLSGDGASSEKRAKKMASASKLQTTLLAFAPTRALLRRFKLPKPGEGPNKEQREKGRYEVVFFGETA